MSQSTYIAAFLLAGFVLFLAAQNRLSAYTAVLWGNTASALPVASVTPQSSGGGTGGTLSSIAGAAKTAASVAGFLGL